MTAQSDYPNRLHPSHKKIRSSIDSSTFDQICDDCGAHDQVPGGWGELAKPCAATKEVEAPRIPSSSVGSAWPFVMFTALQDIANTVSTPKSSSQEDRLYSALDTLDKVRAMAREALAVVPVQVVAEVDTKDKSAQGSRTEAGIPSYQKEIGAQNVILRKALQAFVDRVPETARRKLKPDQLVAQAGIELQLFLDADAALTVCDTSDDMFKRSQDIVERLASVSENFARRFSMNDLTEDLDQQRQSVLHQAKAARRNIRKLFGFEAKE